MESESLPRHPIRVVARRTGLTAATIRAWERRYGAVSPGRSEGGQRLYSDRDLARLDTLRRLTELGRSIGSVAALTEDQAQALLDEERASPAPRPPATEAEDPWIARAYENLRALDDTGLDRTLRRGLATLGAHAFLLRVAVPLLREVGNGWQSGEVSPAQEHLGSAVPDRILADIADDAGERDGDAPRLVVATLPGERHALGARLVAATAALEGWRVSYLGPDLPPEEIAAAAAAVGADAVAISVVSDEAPDATLRGLAALRGTLEPDVELLVGGRGTLPLAAKRPPVGIAMLPDLESLRVRLTEAAL